MPLSKELNLCCPQDLKDESKTWACKVLKVELKSIIKKLPGLARALTLKFIRRKVTSSTRRFALKANCSGSRQLESLVVNWLHTIHFIHFQIIKVMATGLKTISSLKFLILAIGNTKLNFLQQLFFTLLLLLMLFLT